MATLAVGIEFYYSNAPKPARALTSYEYNIAHLAAVTAQEPGIVPVLNTILDVEGSAPAFYNVSLDEAILYMYLPFTEPLTESDGTNSLVFELYTTDLIIASDEYESPVRAPDWAVSLKTQYDGIDDIWVLDELVQNSKPIKFVETYAGRLNVIPAKLEPIQGWGPIYLPVLAE